MYFLTFLTNHKTCCSHQPSDQTFIIDILTPFMLTINIETHENNDANIIEQKNLSEQIQKCERHQTLVNNGSERTKLIFKNIKLMIVIVVWNIPTNHTQNIIHGDPTIIGVSPPKKYIILNYKYKNKKETNYCSPLNNKKKLLNSVLSKSNFPDN